MSDFIKPSRELTWEYVEYLEGLNERLAQQVVGIADRVQESVRGIMADTWDAAIDAAAAQGTIQIPDNPYRQEAWT